VTTIRSFIERVGAVGSAPDDSDELRLQKQTLVLASVVIVVLATAYVATYALLGRPLAASIPLAFQAIAIVSLIAFAASRSFAPFRRTILTAMLLLPFALQWVLGGFIASSAVCLWSLTTALSALFFYGPRGAIPWFVAFLGLLVVSGLADPMLAAAADPLPDRVVLLFFVLTVALVSGTLFLLLQFALTQRERAMARSESLLLNILPGPIAARLKRAPGTIAEATPDATVLFADIAGFTPLAAALDPPEVIRLLDEVFGLFDRLADRHGLEKIKTIGDAYMVVGGVPVARPDHAEAVAEFGLEILESIGMLAVDGRTVELRVGMDRGPVVAGVIGRRKFSYDLWGDTVNMASRMESHGVPGRIQVTSRVEECLRYAYRFERRGPIAVKGKGEVDTFFLVGRR
jgi:class 3 adenylate cyclase